MNYIQLMMWAVYVAGIYVAGSSLHYFIFRRQPINSRSLFVGESLLLGSIWTIGLLLALSLVYLYRAPFLWVIVLMQFLFLFHKEARLSVLMPFKGVRVDVSLSILTALLVFFLFRNCYFLVDADSHSTYLFAQKLWLHYQTSLFASPALDIKVFVPQFNAVPYALGISVLPKELFFPQLIVALWTVIVVMLVYGYLSFRFNRAYGLAGAMLVLFNDHIFYSGANNSVVINSALIALLTAAAYNFIEASRGQTWRMILALICVTHVLANKYQALYMMLLLVLCGLFIQKDWKAFCSLLRTNQRWIIGLCAAAVFSGLWFLKNLLSTGCPTFPILAGEMGIMNWTQEMSAVFNKAFGGPLSFLTAIKYLNYMFIWPGIHAAKLMAIFIVFLPFIMLIGFNRRLFDQKQWVEAVYWSALAGLMVLGLCWVSFVDPRHYRYAIGIMAIGSVVMLDLVLRQLLRCPRWMAVAVILTIALSGWKIIFSQGGDLKRPTLADNAAVLMNQLHTQERTAVYYPANEDIYRQWSVHKDKLTYAAWDLGEGGSNGISAFLAPVLPQVGLWYTTAVRWDSYKDASLIRRDLEYLGIDWILSVKDRQLVFESVNDYAGRAVHFERFPKRVFYNYGFPEELAGVKY